MIGKISKGGSFAGCISYVLGDKKRTEKEKLEMLAIGLDPHNRAEVILYNKCFGGKLELINDFNEVRRLNERVEKPVLHISLRLADGEQLDKGQLMETAEACARQMGFADNQYIAVLHRDTKGQHIHIVANRVGFDGKLVSDANDFRKIAALCRELEEKFGIQKVLSPRKFLHEKQRLLPRHNQRKDKLASDIRSTLQNLKDYASFEREMNALGYKILKGRGICFIDEKKARFKGSEVGFSLARIEKILVLQQQLANINSRRELLHVAPVRPSWEWDRAQISKEEHPHGHRETSDAFSPSGNIVELLLSLLRVEPTCFGHITPDRKRKSPRPNW